MLIITDKVGQLGNRLFLFSYVIANSIEKGYSVLNLNFEDYNDNFEGLSNPKFKYKSIITRFFVQLIKIEYLSRKIFSKLQYIFQKNRFFKSFIHYSIHIPNDSFDLNKNSLELMAKTKLVFLSGSWYFDYQNFIKHADQIRAFFTPIESHRVQINLKLSKIKNENAVVIGVHIRKGDYEHFMEGQYFLDNELYKSKMEQAKKLLEPLGKEIRFLICSNEPVNLEEFKDLNIYYQPDHFIVDLYSLAKCDYLIGPLSTFSMWASFYGKVPLWQITKEDIELTINDFQIKDYC
jgi:hypothetical protein